MSRAVPIVLPAHVALRNRHPVQERSRREHPHGGINIPFLTYEDDHRRSKTVYDVLYEAGLYPADTICNGEPAWRLRTVVGLKYQSNIEDVMCVVDWGPKFDLYRYQWVSVRGFDEDARQLVLDNIMDRDSLVQHADEVFWASPYAEANLRELFR